MPQYHMHHVINTFVKNNLFTTILYESIKKFEFEKELNNVHHNLELLVTLQFK